ncbi:unnamed protein product [Cylicocyclus nassatus]|uniref:Uncharacterized protein n=1 Tax=Cylicocyclus nassatus TaxID=53992 RepID=A0AA36MC91_CYLNA|nr:unnamed protein product [Cylicocyclus nassatus]
MKDMPNHPDEDAGSPPSYSTICILSTAILPTVDTKCPSNADSLSPNTASPPTSTSQTQSTTSKHKKTRPLYPPLGVCSASAAWSCSSQLLRKDSVPFKLLQYESLHYVYMSNWS